VSVEQPPGVVTCAKVAATTVCGVPGCPEPVSTVVLAIVRLDRRPEQEHIYVDQVCEAHGADLEVMWRSTLRLEPPRVIYRRADPAA
jgi:hypothetical protein